MNLINYEIFRQRKKFNPLKLFERNENLTYEMFCNFFESRFVIPPDNKYFLRVKEEFEKNKVNNEEQVLDVKVNEVTDAKDDSTLKVPDLEIEKNAGTLTDNQIKPKPKRKRRKRNEQN